MQISETKPTERTFTLSLTADELRVVERALLADDSARKSGEVSNFDVWADIHDYMQTYAVAQLREQDEDEDDDLPF